MTNMMVWVLFNCFAFASTAQVDMRFSPNGGCTVEIVKQIDAAKSSVRVQAYSFTSQKIADAFVAALNRKVKVEVIIDETQAKAESSIVNFLRDKGMTVLLDGHHKQAHNKVIIIDDKIVITGSFNFTDSAESENAENIVIISGSSVAQRFVENFDLHRHDGTKSETQYVASKGSRKGGKFHRPTCRIAGTILEKNRVFFSNREDAVKSGYEPCKICKP
jgi:phosphatidylserine/phosphatidylglycerophosphate/cardiolipin synthase-like enzyme